MMDPDMVDRCLPGMVCGYDDGEMKWPVVTGSNARGVLRTEPWIIKKFVLLQIILASISSSTPSATVTSKQIV
jgi:hypothetical protein